MATNRQYFHHIFILDSYSISFRSHLWIRYHPKTHNYLFNNYHSRKRSLEFFLLSISTGELYCHWTLYQGLQEKPKIHFLRQIKNDNGNFVSFGRILFLYCRFKLRRGLSKIKSRCLAYIWLWIRIFVS